MPWYCQCCLVERLANPGRRGGATALQLIRQPHVIFEEDSPSSSNSPQEIASARPLAAANGVSQNNNTLSAGVNPASPILSTQHNEAEGKFCLFAEIS